MPSTLQDWVTDLSFMQQTVLISAVRGCDGIRKFHPAKPLVKWYRRCVLLSAFDGRVLTDAFESGGGSFTGPIADINEAVDNSQILITDPPKFMPLTDRALHDWRCAKMQEAADAFIVARDELPLHYVTHMMHAFQIVGYKHPDEGVRWYFQDIYTRLVHAFHLWPETEEQMDKRLDNEAGWRERSDISASCSD